MAQRFIYVIGVTSNPVKVGIADDVAKRLATLQSGCPDKLVVHHKVTVPFTAAQPTEAAVHKRFRSSHRHGEWFDVEADDALAAIREESEAIIRRVNEAMDTDEPEVDRLVRLKMIPTDIRIAITKYREKAQRPSGTVMLDRAIHKRAGTKGWAAFQMVVVQHRSFVSVLHRDPRTLRAANEALAEALWALWGALYPNTLKKPLDRTLDLVAG